MKNSILTVCVWIAIFVSQMAYAIDTSDIAYAKVYMKATLNPQHEQVNQMFIARLGDTVTMTQASDKQNPKKVIKAEYVVDQTQHEGEYRLDFKFYLGQEGMNWIQLHDASIIAKAGQPVVFMRSNSDQDLSNPDLSNQDLASTQSIQAEVMIVPMTEDEKQQLH